jgi:hypothetical protein
MHSGEEKLFHEEVTGVREALLLAVERVLSKLNVHAMADGVEGGRNQSLHLEKDSGDSAIEVIDSFTGFLDQVLEVGTERLGGSFGSVVQQEALLDNIPSLDIDSW